MERDDILEVTGETLASLALDQRTPADVRERVAVIADKLSGAGLVVRGAWVPHEELSYIFEGRLRRQLKRQPENLTIGLSGLVDGIRSNTVERILLVAVTTDEFWAHIYAVGEPSWLIGCTAGPTGRPERPDA